MDDRRIRPELSVMIAWLAHPVTVLAVVLLAVNDHLLKPAYPGLVTGKLSDVAGLVVAPALFALLCSALLPRLSVTPAALAGLLVTGVGFVLVKATSAGAAVASAGWSLVSGPSVIRADPTDLLALPALGLAAWVCTLARDRPAAGQVLRRFGVLVVLPFAALAIAATSAPQYPDTVAVGSWRDQLVIGQANAYHAGREPTVWQVSADDGRTWDRMVGSELAAFEQDQPTLVLTARQACLPDRPTDCYRVLPGQLGVESTTDGGASWSVDWRVSENQRAYLERSYEELGDPATFLSAQALTVHPVPGGHLVLVANGRDGVALRGLDGGWTRLGFADYGYGQNAPVPLRTEPFRLGTEILLAILIGLLAVVITVGSAARGRGAAVPVFTAPLAIGVPLAVFGAFATKATWLVGVMALAIALVGLGLVLVCLTGLISAAIARGLPRRRLPLLLLPSLTAIGWFMPFVGWTRDLTSYRVALVVAVAAMVVGFAVAGWLGRRLWPPVSTEPDQPTSAPAGHGTRAARRA